jgi:hypothetical protein
MTIRFSPVNFIVQVSDSRNALVLAAGVAQAFTVPAEKNKVILSVDLANVALWVNINVAAVIPVGNITDGSAPMLNPAGFEVISGQTISCICASACTVSALYYS